MLAFQVKHCGAALAFQVKHCGAALAFQVKYCGAALAFQVTHYGAALAFQAKHCGAALPFQAKHCGAVVLFQAKHCGAMVPFQAKHCASPADSGSVIYAATDTLRFLVPDFPLLVPVPFLSALPLHGNPLWTHSNQTSEYFFSQNYRLPCCLF